MPKYVKKDTATGAIRSFFATYAGVDYPVSLVERGATLVVYPWTEDQANTGKFYMPGDEVIERPKVFEQDEISIPADGETKVTAQLIKGTVVRFDGDSSTAGKKQPFEFSTAVPGEYVFEIEGPFPLQSQRVRITAHAV